MTRRQFFINLSIAFGVAIVLAAPFCIWDAQFKSGLFGPQIKQEKRWGKTVTWIYANQRLIDKWWYSVEGDFSDSTRTVQKAAAEDYIKTHKTILENW